MYEKEIVFTLSSYGAFRLQEQEIKPNRAERRAAERRKEVKDNSTHVEKSQKVSAFDLQQTQTYEITLESDKDSVGNAKEVVYYRIRTATRRP